MSLALPLPSCITLGKDLDLILPSHLCNGGDEGAGDIEENAREVFVSVLFSRYFTAII